MPCISTYRLKFFIAKKSPAMQGLRGVIRLKLWGGARIRNLNHNMAMQRSFARIYGAVVKLHIRSLATGFPAMSMAPVVSATV